MGVVAALVLTVAAAGFALGPTCWNGANLYNTQASLLLTMCLAASFAFSLYTISGSYEIIAQSLKVQNDRFLEWVLFWKGHVCWEYQGTMLASLLTLTASMLALIYLLKGGLHFWIAAGIIGGIILVSTTCMSLLHEHLLQHHLFTTSDQAPGCDRHTVTSDAHVAVVVAQTKQQRAAAGLAGGDQSPRCVLGPPSDDRADLEQGLGAFPGRSWASGMLGSTYLVRPPSHTVQGSGCPTGSGDTQP